MSDLSIIIPARNEEFLQNTIDNILKNMKGDTEIWAMLDGYWPEKSIPQHDKVNVVHHSESIGQRAATNEGALLCDSKFIMKADAHCAFDKGFDIKLMEDCEYDWTIIPTQYNLHAFDWKCHQCGKRTYQGPQPKKCGDCGTTDKFKKKILFKAKKRPRCYFYRFDMDLKFGYWRDFKHRPEAQADDLVPTMSNLGACWFMHRQRFMDIDMLDEDHGSWGQMGTEISCKTWLSGGKQFTNKKTWYAHMFRTGGGFGFPYKIKGSDQKKARKYSQDLWKNNKWDKAVHDLDWLLKKFWPIPGWEDYQFQNETITVPETKLKDIKITDSTFSNKKENVPSEESAPLKSTIVTNKVTPTKGCIYYTSHRCNEDILKTVRDQIDMASGGIPITSASLYPIDFGKNIIVSAQPSVLTMFKQILIALENIDTDVVFFTEHDVLYHPSHFDFIPPEKDKFYYNQNSWFLDSDTGQALFYYANQVSGICVYRDLAIKHYRTRVERVEKEGFKRRMGFEPGSHKPPRGFDLIENDTYFSEYPNIDIRHGKNLTGKRFKKEQFRTKNLKGWTLANEIPYWGKTKDRFDDFLFDLNNCNPSL